jgi:MoxR-like ATPase
MTSNSEREFPAPFLRRCIQLAIRRPDLDRLKAIVRTKLEPEKPEAYHQYQQVIEERIIPAFAQLVDEQRRDLAVDQLLQVVLLVMHDIDPFGGVNPLDLDEHGELIDALWRSLREGGA